MKNYFLLSIFALFLLSGCASKSNFLLTFDNFSIKMYDNNKQYVELPIVADASDMILINKLKEQATQDDTGFINSLLITKMPIQSGTNITILAAENIKILKSKLLKYVSIDSSEKKIKCITKQDSGYILSFSYELDNQMLYGGQYMFVDSDTLYLISLATDTKQDINRFIKSIGTIKCL